MMTSQLLISRIILATAVLTTLVVSPGITYDPINLPKMLILATGASFIFPLLVFQIKVFLRQHVTVLIFSTIFVAAQSISIFMNDRPMSQQVWGIWGRSTGLLTYTSFIIILLASVFSARPSNLISERKCFERLSYFVTVYTLLQVADLDPISWSQNAMVATLGNINFMSSFLGLASISFFSRIFFEGLSISARFNFIFYLAINLLLIYKSNSIQGIGIFLSGVVLVMTFQINQRFKRVFSISWLSGSIASGILLLLGTGGLGPLSALTQETVVFRVDYWLAGISMTSENLISGVGIDSYGDYYQQFRSLDAVLRTGPQRISNTAHNIFLDVASGSGLVAGLAFTGIFVLGLLKILIMLKNKTATANEVVFASMFVGFLVFCLISINQIGVGIWGFIFLGYLLGTDTNKLIDKKPRNLVRASSESIGADRKRNIKSTPTSKGTLVVCSLSLAIGFYSAWIPNQLDAKMLRAVKQKDFDSMEGVASSKYSSVFHRNTYQSLLVEAGLWDSAKNFAIEEIRRNSRSEISWRILALAPDSTEELQKMAGDVLIAMDPKNENLRKELKARDLG